MSKKEQMNELKKKVVSKAKDHALFSPDKKIVFGRGSFEPEILFIGESPGFQENISGRPFVGASGKLLEKQIAFLGNPKHAITNAVPLIPLEDGKIRKPTTEEISYFKFMAEEMIGILKPKAIVLLGKSAAEAFGFSAGMRNAGKFLKDNFYFVPHPAYLLRNGLDGFSYYKELKGFLNDDFVKELDYDCNKEEAVNDFLKKISAKKIDNGFVFQEKKYFLDFHPWSHSDDIIVGESEAKNFDYFLLVKTKESKQKIVGWCDKKQLLSTPARDIYRTGKKHHVVHDTNVKDLSFFKIKKEKKFLKDFSINSEKAESLGRTEMINGVLAGLHFFTKRAGIYFKDVNQKDICFIGDKKIKIFIRNIENDEDMLVHEDFFQDNKDIDLFITCKIKAGIYDYIGYADRALVEQTRVVNMIGASGQKMSDKIRRIFAEQYSHLSDFIKIETKDKEEEKIEMQSYTPLHVHCTFSVGDAFGSPEYLAKSVRKRGFKACALTDHGTLGGVLKFQRAMLEEGLKPIIGCEIYTKVSPDEKAKKYHLTVLVKNKEGWKNLLALQEEAVRENFYYKPVVPLDSLLEKSNGLIVTNGCISSIVCDNLAKENFDEAEKYFVKLKEVFKDDFYAEIMPHVCINNQKVMELVRDLCKKHSVKMIVTTDSHYPYPEEKKYHDAIKAIDFKKKYGEAGYGDDCFYLMKDKELSERFSKVSNWVDENTLKEMMDNTNEIAEKCNFVIEPPKEKDTMPKLFSEGEKRANYFKKITLEGLEKFTPYKYEGKIKERLDLEFDRIIGKEYDNYFLIVRDYVQWAKKNGIKVGVGRGSAGASLVAYALNITECDPIKYDLLFTRFLSPIRRDMPDIDLDFQDNRRQEVFDYLRKTYGDANCAKVITYARQHAKGLLRDIGRIFSIPISEIEKICSLSIERCISGDSKIQLDTGKVIKLKKLFSIYDNEKNIYHKKKRSMSWDLKRKRFVEQAIKNVYYAGKKQMFELITKSGKKIKASEDHRFLTKNGWKKLKDLHIDDEIMTYTEKVDYVKCKICGKIFREVNSDHLHKHNMNKKIYFEKFGTKDVCKDVSERKGWQKCRPYIGKKLFGKDNPMSNKKNRAKWYEKINDKNRRKIHSAFMKKNNPMYDKKVASKAMKNFCKIFKEGSKPQKELYRIIRKNYCGRMSFDFFVRTKRSFRFLDVALLNDKIDFEYDGSFWHKGKYKKDDLRRKREIEQIGWTVISIDEKKLNEKFIKSELERLGCLKK